MHAYIVQWYEFISLGLPGTVMLCSEWWAFEFLTIMATFLGTAAVDAETIILQICSLAFMMPLGSSNVIEMMMVMMMIVMMIMMMVMMMMVMVMTIEMMMMMMMMIVMTIIMMVMMMMIVMTIIMMVMVMMEKMIIIVMMMIIMIIMYEHVNTTLFGDSITLLVCVVGRVGSDLCLIGWQCTGC